MEKFGLETQLIKAGGGEFTVWVGDQKVAAKGIWGFPDEAECLAGVEKALAVQSG